MEPKITTLLPTCFLITCIAMHLVCRCSLTFWRRSSLKKGTPVKYFGGSGPKTTTLVRDHEYFILTKFHQNPSSGSGKEVENVKSLWTDGGQCAMTIAHSSLQLWWAKKVWKIWLRNGTENTTLLSTCSFSITLHSVCSCSLPVWRKSSLKKGTPKTYFCPPWIRTWVDLTNKQQTCEVHEYFISNKFHQNPLSGPGEEIENANILQCSSYP